jgi:hypothetical protein
MGTARGTSRCSASHSGRSSSRRPRSADEPPALSSVPAAITFIPHGGNEGGEAQFKKEERATEGAEAELEEAASNILAEIPVRP